MTETTFGHYRLLALLGRGGMGEVWRALDTRKDRVVALKVLGPWLGGDEQFAQRFVREASLAARLRGPHIVPIHDYGSLDGRLFIDMALVDGVDLAALLADTGPLPADRAVDLLAQTAKALDTAHRAGMVHRDVKPSNVLVSDNGGDDFVHLIDFGIARAVDGTSVSLSGVLVGTPTYMAPERFDGRGDHRSDVYALGCVLHEMLTGRPPFQADGFWAWGMAHHRTPPPRPSDGDASLPRGLDDVVARALAKDPGARFPSAGALAAAARAAVSATRPPTPLPAGAPTSVPAPRLVGTPPQATGATPPQTLLRGDVGATGTRGRWPRRGLPIAAAVTAAVAVLVAAVLVGGRDDPAQGLVGAAAATTTAAPTSAGPTPSASPSPAPAPRTVTRIGVGEYPYTVALTRDGAQAYVVNDGSGSVSVIDTARGTVTATIPVGGRPGDLALAPDGRHAYVPDLGVYPAKGTTVAVVDTAAGRVSGTITVGSIPDGVAVAPDGRTLYVANYDSRTVSLVDTATNGVVATVPSCTSPTAVAVAPDGARAYVTCEAANRVSVIDTAARTAAASVRVGRFPESLAVSPDGNQVYVANKDPGGGVSVIDTATNTVSHTIPTGDGPNAVAFGPDGRRAYVTNFFSNSVSVVDTAAVTVVATLTGYDSPDSVAVSPDGRTVYVAENAAAGRIAVVPVAPA